MHLQAIVGGLSPFTSGDVPECMRVAGLAVLAASVTEKAGSDSSLMNVSYIHVYFITKVYSGCTLLCRGGAHLKALHAASSESSLRCTDGMKYDACWRSP